VANEPRQRRRTCAHADGADLCFQHSEPSRPTFFRSAARGLHVPTTLTREPTKHEARKRRASARPRVGCCEELGAADSALHTANGTIARTEVIPPIDKVLTIHLMPGTYVSVPLL
jgi:hypothetical protein